MGARGRVDEERVLQLNRSVRDEMRGKKFVPDRKAELGTQSTGSFLSCKNGFEKNQWTFLTKGIT